MRGYDDEVLAPRAGHRWWALRAAALGLLLPTSRRRLPAAASGDDPPAPAGTPAPPPPPAPPPTLTPPRSPTPPHRPGHVRLFSVIIVVLITVPGAVLALRLDEWAGRIRLDATTTPETTAAPVPTTARTVVWRTFLPDRARLLGAGPRGPVIGLTDGVSALDGSTGQELWHHRRRGRQTDVMLSGNGRWVILVTHSSSGPWGGSSRSDVLVLDAGTGRVVTRSDDHGVPPLDATDTHAVHQADRRGAVRISPLPELTPVRRADIPEDCAVREVTAGVNLLVVAQICPPTQVTGGHLRVTAVDPATGGARWFRASRPFALGSGDGTGVYPTIELAPDDTAVLVRADRLHSAQGDGPARPWSGLTWVLRGSDGQLLSEVRRLGVRDVRVVPGQQWFTEDVTGNYLLHESRQRSRPSTWQEYLRRGFGTPLPNGATAWLDLDPTTGLRISGPRGTFVPLPDVQDPEPLVPNSDAPPLAVPGAIVVSYCRDSPLESPDPDHPRMLVGLR